MEWFANVAEKNHSSFMVFDIENFYPSIILLIEILDYEMSLINQSPKTLLFNEKMLVRILMFQWDVLMDQKFVS